MDIIEIKIKTALVRSKGIDRALKILEKDYAVHPFQLIRKAVMGQLITEEEIPVVLDAAINKADEVTIDYRDSGEGIGSSDMTFFTMYMLQEAGLNVGFVNNKLERIK